jgi:hypothetical protein
MSLSITPTLALVGEPEATPEIRPESLVASYTTWVTAAEALIAAQQAEFVSFDDLVVTIGRANIDCGQSLRSIADEIKETGVEMPVVTDGDVKRMYPSHTTIGRWVTLYVIMRDGDVTSAVARQVTEGMGNDGMPTPAQVRKTAEEASADGKDVLNAVRALFSKAKAPTEPKPIDPSAEIKRMNTSVGKLGAEGVSLTVDDKANVAALIVRLQSLIG